MCRLYVFKSSEQTKVECTLVHAQNALMAQSRQDLSGYSHSHGWGVATYDGEQPQIEKQAWAAYHGEHFARTAARIYSDTVIAHVRRATVGGAAMENTHPFGSGRWAFVHNGTVPHFKQVAPSLTKATSKSRTQRIKGATDSEHLFHYALTLMDENPQLELTDIIRLVINTVTRWVTEIDEQASIGLNLVLTDGQQIAGSRMGRSLYAVNRTGVYDCEICGFPHIHHTPDREHRAVVIASEPITREDWREIPDISVWYIGTDASLQIEPL